MTRPALVAAVAVAVAVAQVAKAAVERARAQVAALLGASPGASALARHVQCQLALQCSLLQRLQRPPSQSRQRLMLLLRRRDRHQLCSLQPLLL